MSDFRFRIIKHLGVLSTSRGGWQRELNVVSWNDMEPKFDIRDWDPSHEKMSKGVTLSAEEGYILAELLNKALEPGKDSRFSGKRLCPRCGKFFAEAPAVSRTDNETEICPACGTVEALLDASSHGAFDETDAKDAAKERCTDCACLVEGNSGEWICDEKQMDIHDVKDCPEGLGTI